jgi:hypothetical protein
LSVGSRVHVKELVTHRYAPEECQTAYEGAVDRKAEQLGALFIWPDAGASIS